MLLRACILLANLVSMQRHTSTDAIIPILCSQTHLQIAVHYLEAESKAHPDVGKLQGKLTCQASRGRRVHPPSVPVPEAATIALAVLHQPWRFLELAIPQYPWPDLLPHCSQNKYTLKKHPSLRFWPSQQSRLLPRVLYQLHSIAMAWCTGRQYMFHVNACQIANKCMPTICTVRQRCVHAISPHMTNVL